MRNSQTVPRPVSEVCSPQPLGASPVRAATRIQNTCFSAESDQRQRGSRVCPVAASTWTMGVGNAIVSHCRRRKPGNNAVTWWRNRSECARMRRRHGSTVCVMIRSSEARERVQVEGAVGSAPVGEPARGALRVNERARLCGGSFARKSKHRARKTCAAVKPVLSECAVCVCVVCV